MPSSDRMPRKNTCRYWRATYKSSRPAVLPMTESQRQSNQREGRGRHGEGELLLDHESLVVAGGSALGLFRDAVAELRDGHLRDAFCGRDAREHGVGIEVQHRGG